MELYQSSLILFLLRCLFEPSLSICCLTVLIVTVSAALIKANSPGLALLYKSYHVAVLFYDESLKLR